MFQDNNGDEQLNVPTTGRPRQPLCCPTACPSRGDLDMGFESLSFGRCLRPLSYLLRLRSYSIFTASDSAACTNEQADRPEKRRRASPVTLFESARRTGTAWDGTYCSLGVFFFSPGLQHETSSAYRMSPLFACLAQQDMN